MLKAIVVGSVVGLAALTLPVQAQGQTPAPGQTPSNQAPSAQPAPNAAPAADVSQAELEKFASTVKQFQSIQEEAQQQADQILASEELSPERFTQILQSQQNPQGQQPSPEVSAIERQNFQQAIEKLAELQKTTRERMDQALQEEGMQRERFSQIMALVRQDAGLRQRVQQQLQN